jgi:hypothetical protein
MNTCVEYWPDVWLKPYMPQTLRDRSIWMKPQLRDLDRRAEHLLFDQCNHGQIRFVWLDQPHLWLCADCSRPPRAHAAPNEWATCDRCLRALHGIDLLVFQVGDLMVTGDKPCPGCLVPLWARTELCEDCLWSEWEGI